MTSESALGRFMNPVKGFKPSASNTGFNVQSNIKPAVNFNSALNEKNPLFSMNQQINENPSVVTIKNYPVSKIKPVFRKSSSRYEAFITTTSSYMPKRISSSIRFKRKGNLITSELKNL